MRGVERAPSGWHVDPSGRYQHRYWDGNGWTLHVATGGRQAIDSVAAAPPPPASPLSPPPASPLPPPPSVLPTLPTPPASLGQASKRIARQARHAGVDSVDTPGGGTLFTEQVLVINQRPRAFGAASDYAIYSQDGRRLGSINEARRDLGEVIGDRYRGVSSDDRQRRFVVADMDGTVLLQILRPERDWRGILVIQGPQGVPIGQIVQESKGFGGVLVAAAELAAHESPRIVRKGIGGLKGLAAGAGAWSVRGPVGAAIGGLDEIGHVRFGLEAGGRRLGSIHTKSIEERKFTIRDQEGLKVGRIRRTEAGLTEKRFKADHYVVVMHRPLEEPLRTLVIGAALAIDVALE